MSARQHDTARRTIGPLSALFLAGCFSGEPSTTDMANALHGNQGFRQGVVLLMEMGDRLTRTRTAHDVDAFLKTGVVEKIGCSAAQGVPGYVCDFKWGIRQPNGSVSFSPPAKARFFKGSGGWNMDDV